MPATSQPLLPGSGKKPVFSIKGEIMNSYKLHECEKLPQNGVQIIYSMDNEERKDIIWRLVIRCAATEDDLEKNTFLQEIDETLWETSLEIIHCPFCGKFLPEIAGKIYPDHGKFMHYDFSR